MSNPSIQPIDSSKEDVNLYIQLRLIQSIKKKRKKRHYPNVEQARASKVRTDTIREARRIAISCGHKRFSPGVLCRNGHIGDWYTLPNQSGSVCVECRNLNVRNWSLKQEGVDFIPVATRPMPDNCECCNRPIGNRAFHRDHDHKTMVFRGWLCVQCNLGIGKLGDDIEGLVLAIDYIKRAMN